MARDPDMRVGRITAEEIRSRLPNCGTKFNRVGSVEEVFGTRSITIADVLNMKNYELYEGNGPDYVATVEDMSGSITTVMEPALVGRKVFLLMLADYAETYLGDFEWSGWNDPAPRVMVDGIREFAFGKITSTELQVLVNAAYAGQNSRSYVSLSGKLATLVDGGETKEFRDFMGAVRVQIEDQRTFEQVRNIIDRMKEYDLGTVDLTSEITARPKPRSSKP